MQTPTPEDGPGVVKDGGIVEKEVETVRTRERVAGTDADTTAARVGVSGERSGRYLETLPERLSAVAFVVLVAIEGLLGMRFLLSAFGANPSNSFVRFIENVSWPFARPFANIFSNRTWDQGVVEVSVLVAMGAYVLLFALIGMLVTALAPRLSGKGNGLA